MAAISNLNKERRQAFTDKYYTGWMWGEEDFPPRADELDLPKISVITPSFNQGKFIERTIRSVLLQKYPSLEYIVIDGGSTDNSVDVIRKYERHLAYWVSEPDRGQSHAINKGLSVATGQVLCWLNSDDFYLPNALATVGKMLADGNRRYAVAGHCLRIHENGDPPVFLEGKFESRRRLLEFWKGYQMHQPAIFWRREVFEKVGWLNENLHLIMDFDYWVRIAEHFEFITVDEVFACCSYHAKAKTGDNYRAYHRDLNKYSYDYWGSKLGWQFWLLFASKLEHSTRVFAARPRRWVKSVLRFG